MNVLAVSSLYRPHIGGVETMIEEMAEVLDDNGHKLEVIAKQWPEELAQNEVINGINVTRVPTGKSEEELLNIAGSFRDLRDKFVQADVVHVIGMRRPLPLFSVLLSRISDTPVIGSVVGTEVPNPGSTESEIVWQEGKEYMTDSYLSATHITAVSESTRQLTLDVIPELEGKIQVVPVGINLKGYESIQPSNPLDIGKFILSLRRLEQSKGVDILINAYSNLINSGKVKGIDLLIAGDGPERAKLESLARSKGVASESIHFIGNLSLNSAIGALKTAEMTVVPSLAEGGGIINTEANAVGCPLVASNVGGIGEYTTSEAALLVPPGHETALADAMFNVYNNSELRRKMVIAGKIFAQTRDWRSLIQEYLNLYDSVRDREPRPLQLKSMISNKVLEILEH